MGKTKMVREIAELIEGMAADLESGKVKHWWDAEFQPRKEEKDGRAKMLRYILENIERIGK